jgi:cytochrome c biogenesis protein CcmG, thiol:disulfide interchange protein DsbE
MSSETWQKPDDVDPLQGRSFRLTGVFVIVVAAGLLGAWIFNSGSGDSAGVGHAAPDFAVENIERGEPIVLSELVARDDRPIVINLMASWCGPCREEIPELSAFADANPGVLVLGVAVDDTYDDFKQFVTEVRPTYTVGFDKGAMRKLYPTFGLPATFFLDSDGVVVEVFNGILDQEVLEELVAGLS